MKIIYIHGAGHSGSTLLGNAIGTSPDAISVGELQTVKQMKPQGFWKNILQDIDQTKLSSMLYRPAQRLKFALSVFFKPSKDKLNVEDQKLLKTILSQGKANTIVDGSKSLIQLNKLRNTPACKVKVIHLERRGEEVLASAYLRGKKKGNPTQQCFRAMKIWLFGNFLGRVYLSKTKAPHIKVSYEQFASQPAKEMKKICDWADIRFNKEWKSEINKHKNAGGNSGVSKVQVQKIEAVTKIDKVPNPWRIIFKAIAFVPNSLRNL